MAILEYRKEHAGKLREIRDKLGKVKNIIDALPPLDCAEDASSLSAELAAFRAKVEQRLGRVESPYCHIAVIGLEKQGKSTFVNAWVGTQALPSDTKRCTWAASTIVNGNNYKAEVHFSSRSAMDKQIDGLFADLGISRVDAGFPLPDSIRELDKMKGKDTHPAFKDLEQLSKFWKQINLNLDKAPQTIRGENTADLYDQLFRYISLREKDTGNEQGVAYAVERADIHFPMTDANLEFAIDDLPGIDAPGNRAEDMTWNSVEHSADVIVLVKNAFNNASLNAAEEKIWDKARISDTSIKLTDRLFVILNQADAEKIEHGRDCHQQAFENFTAKGAPGDRIFYCSSRAELFKKMDGKGLSFPYSQDEFDKAAGRIGTYRNQSATTGFPEFEDALYKFLETDFPALERRALQDLIAENETLLQKLRLLAQVYAESQTSEKSATATEQERFDALWAPGRLPDLNTGGLAVAIRKIVNSEVREVIEKPDVCAKFVAGIRETINNSRTRLCEEITVEGFNAMDLTRKASSLRNFSKMRNDYFEKIQGALKDEAYHNLAGAISHNITGHLRAIWEKALNAKTDNSDCCLAAVGADTRNEFFAKRLLNSHNDILARVFTESHTAQDGQAEYGFAALLKSVVHAPAEYLLNPEKDYDDDRIRLLRKANLYQKGLCEDGTSEKVRRAFSGVLESTGSDSTEVFKDLVDKNIPLMRKLVELFLPKPFSVLSELVLHSAASGKSSAKDNPFEGTVPSTAEYAAPHEPEETPEAVVEDLKKRVDLFYFILDAMLFDGDFGFIGYYRAFLEEFRSAVDAQTNEGGAIRALAYQYRAEIWPSEPEFKSNEERARLERRLAALTALVQ